MVIELLETSEETTTKMQCLTEESGCQSEAKTNVIVILIMTSIMITTCFCTNGEHYQLLLSYFCH